jgi:hypothetical protein
MIKCPDNSTRHQQVVSSGLPGFSSSALEEAGLGVGGLAATMALGLSAMAAAAAAVAAAFCGSIGVTGVRRSSL